MHFGTGTSLIVVGFGSQFIRNHCTGTSDAEPVFFGRLQLGLLKYRRLQLGLSAFAYESFCACTAVLPPISLSVSNAL